MADAQDFSTASDLAVVAKHPISQLPNRLFFELGWDFFVSPDAGDYLSSELVLVTEAEAEAYHAAGTLLYELFCEAAEFIIEENEFEAMGIPANLVRLIKHSWEDDRNLHLMGRFDFAGGIDGLPIRLIEFNADTPTSIPETAIIQWASLRANGLDEDSQFNTLYDALIENFRRLASLNDDLEPRILFSTLRDAPEDEHNVSLLMQAAREAGFEVEFAYVDVVTFSDEEGIFVENPQGEWVACPFWFKLIPWEYIAYEEPELADLLTKIVERRLAVVVNPAYTLLFQSKGILKVLSDLYPEEPTLLKTSFRRPSNPGKGYVEKVFFGREGSNVIIYGPDGEPLSGRGGDYGHYPSVFQDKATLAQDEDGYHYQAGVFFAWEPAGLGFRRSRDLIMDDLSQFVGHFVKG